MLLTKNIVIKCYCCLGRSYVDQHTYYNSSSSVTAVFDFRWHIFQRNNGRLPHSICRRFGKKCTKIKECIENGNCAWFNTPHDIQLRGFSVVGVASYTKGRFWGFLIFPLFNSTVYDVSIITVYKVRKDYSILVKTFLARMIC